MHKGNDFFDEIAARWDEVSRHDSAKVEFLIGKASIEPDMSVLDVGTGTGILVPWILNKVTESGSLTAIDLSDGMLGVARSKFHSPNLHFVCDDIHSFSCDERFDRIVVYSAFPHFLDKQVAISNMARLLKNGGQLQICHSDSRDRINGVHARTPEVVGDHLPPADVVSQMCSKAGLSVLETIDDENFFLVRCRK